MIPSLHSVYVEPPGDELARRVAWFWLALGITLPLGVGLGVLGWGLAKSKSPTVVPMVSAAAPLGPTSPPEVTTAVVTVTKTVPVTRTVTHTVSPLTPTSAAPRPKPAPQGTVVLDEWHNTAADLTCVDVQTFYDNRSDTAVDTLTQTFLTMYTPKHKEGTYPDQVDGPAKALSQTVGIAPYTRKMVMWHVCAPELAAKQNPVRPDGTDYFMSEIGAGPKAFTWRWVRR